jgi:hypothetical protein
MTYDVREMKRGKCGRCGTSVQPQYLWCDNCEDLVVREAPTSPFWVVHEMDMDAIANGEMTEEDVAEGEGYSAEVIEVEVTECDEEELIKREPWE